MSRVSPEKVSLGNIIFADQRGFIPSMTHPDGSKNPTQKATDPVLYFFPPPVAVKNAGSKKPTAKELLQDMEITYTSRQTKTAEQVTKEILADQNPSAVNKKNTARELLQDMEITYTSRQTKTVEEVTKELLAGQNPSSANKKPTARELLQDMEITYTSKQTKTAEEVVEDMLSGKVPCGLRRKAEREMEEIDDIW